MPEEITPGQILEALNNKMDRDGMNGTDGCDFVVEYQMPDANNNYTWYRKYASGWVEQGGATVAGQATPVTVNLPIAMANGKYQIQLTPQITDSTDYTYTLARIATVRNSNNYTNNTTSFMYAVTSISGASTVSVVWEVKGMAATPSA